MLNNDEYNHFIENYLREIKENIKQFDYREKECKSNILKKSLIHKKLIKLKKEFIQNKPIWDDSKNEIDQIISNDLKFDIFIQKGKEVQQRIKTCLIINEINFSITPSTISKSIYTEKLSKQNAKKILKKLKETPSKSKNKQIIVNESDYSFSDDSIDYSISPIVFNLLKINS